MEYLALQDDQILVTWGSANLASCRSCVSPQHLNHLIIAGDPREADVLCKLLQVAFLRMEKPFQIGDMVVISR